MRSQAPLVDIDGRPILWHVIQIYAAQGFKRLLLFTGFRLKNESAPFSRLQRA